jgi:hypothetical protein
MTTTVLEPTVAPLDELVVKVIDVDVVETPQVVPEGEEPSVMSAPPTVTSMSLKSSPEGSVKLDPGTVTTIVCPVIAPLGDVN